MSAERISPAQRARILQDLGLVAWSRRAQAAAGGPVAPNAEPAPVEPARDTGLPTWEALEQAVSVCTRCALADQRKHTVFGVGARKARWMIIGEAPGAEEDRRGEPFVGRAGQLLDAILEAVGTSREEVFITNIVKCRPPDNRDPRPEEAEACGQYLQAQIARVEPALILALGRVAAHNLLGVETPVGRLRGQVHEGPGGRPVVVTYHPAYLLRTPAAKRKTWDDLRLACSHVSPKAA
jgi:uracil-DNA glycosylase